MSTGNWLDLQTLGSQPVMPKVLLDHWCPGSFWAHRVGQDPSDSKSNRLHVDIVRFCFHSFGVYSIDSS